MPHATNFGEAARFAVYYAPPDDHPLTALGRTTLGRNERTGLDEPQPTLPGIAPERLRELTAPPRHYGLHATLKPPFRLAAGTSLAGLLEQTRTLAGGWRRFSVPLAVSTIADFAAVVPAEPSDQLFDLAAQAVRGLDAFRRPLSGNEQSARMVASLTPRQRVNVLAWGYPYVLGDFRFHLTLTGRIADAAERRAVAAALETLLAPALAQPVPVEDVCVFVQPDRASPFRLLARFPLSEA